MGDRTHWAYLAAVAAAALAMDLAFLIWAGGFGDSWEPSAFLILPLIWAGTYIVTLIGSLLPTAVMIAIAQHNRIRALWLFVLWPCGCALILAYIVSRLIWSADLPASDPDYLSFNRAFGRIAWLFECGALAGGFTYWAVLRRLVREIPPNTDPPAS